MFDRWIAFAVVIPAVVAAAFFFRRRVLRYLQFLQQEEYEGKRFVDWFWRNHAWDRRASYVSFVSAMCSLIACVSVGPALGAVVSLLSSVWMYLRARLEENPLTAGKLKLNMTERARRIFNAARDMFDLVLIVTSLAVVALAPHSYILPIFWIALLILIQTIPIFLCCANALLWPGERKLQERLAEEARVKARALHPTVVGITGSFGKTSTKVILSDILSSVRPTFTTPRSINSYMGMTREIRERLRPEHEFAVVEMGAYYIGSIKRMCSLISPSAAIITAIGGMHLERFGSVENVLKAKSELAESLPESGILVVNGDNDGCRKIADAHKSKRLFIYGLEPDRGHLDAIMTDICPGPKGTTFKIKFQGCQYNGSTQLLGKPMLSNLLAAFTMACALGVAPEMALAAIRGVKTESNRLELQKTSISSFLSTVNGTPPRQGRVIRLNDAYNSNPIGFAAALDVLQQMEGRKILVTPGMIELGEKQNDENRRAAEKAASICDLVAVVGTTNRDALVAGLNEGGIDPACVREFSSMKEAFQFLATEYCNDGDVVLIENDLPDVYEGVPQF